MRGAPGGKRLLLMIPRISLALTLSAAAASGAPRHMAFASFVCPRPYNPTAAGRKHGFLALGPSSSSRARVAQGRRFCTAADSVTMMSGRSPAEASGEVPTMTIVSWNVNSVNARIDSVMKYLLTHQPDVLVFQEIKCVSDDFPYEQIKSAGYHCLVNGQKAYNGVAIIAKSLPELIQDRLTGDSDDPLEPQARYIEAKVGDFHICGLYLPNGNPVNSMKFEYKLRWTDRLMDRAEWLLFNEVPFVMLGDYNVCPGDADCFDRDAMEGDAVMHPEMRAKFRALCNLGLVDALSLPAGSLGDDRPQEASRLPGKSQFTYWGYQGRSWERNAGLRIDHMLLSPQAADVLVDCGVHKDVRGWEKPSDHCPVWIRLETRIKHRNLGLGGQGF